MTVADECPPQGGRKQPAWLDLAGIIELAAPIPPRKSGPHSGVNLRNESNGVPTGSRGMTGSIPTGGAKGGGSKGEP